MRAHRRRQSQPRAPPQHRLERTGSGTSSFSFGPPQRCRPLGQLFVLTQAPFLFAAALLTDSIYKGRHRPHERRHRTEIVEQPRFEPADGHGTIRFLTPSPANPAGEARVTLWIKVTNINPFDVTLSTLETTLLFGGRRAATGHFPLRLSIGAKQESVVSIDFSIGSADLTAVRGALIDVFIGSAATYQLDGTVGIDAGRFGQSTFGPTTLTVGSVRQAAVR
jgi:hypothetical protein